MTYFKQAGCVYKKLDALLSAMGVNPVLRNATVVLMGDHGSRKSAGPSFESLDKQDYIDNHSTLFSIKAPGVSPGYDGRKISVQQLFAAFLAESMEVDLTEAEQTVAVPSLKSGEMRVVPMPNF